MNPSGDSGDSMAKAVTVFLPNDERSLLESTGPFKQILCDPKIADKKVRVVSVAGKFRTGKSFLLNVFLRFLKHLENGGLPEDENWLTGERELTGFSWRSGESSDTTGILIWSHPFILKDEDGDDVVVLLMDTQGSFDNSGTFKDCVSVFALSVLVSSLQIYNLRGNIDSSDLEHLSYFAKYGALAMENQEKLKPFQSLLFLIRDWSLNEDYGFDGGQAILKKRLDGNDNQSEELKFTCNGIENSFEQLDCFLMPHPGRKIVKDDANFEELDPEFVKQLYSLVPSIFSRESLISKNISGEAVTCKRLFDYFKMYSKVFGGNSLPAPKSLLSSQTEISHTHAIEKALDLYDTEMSAFSKNDKFFTSDALFQQQHKLANEKAVNCFMDVKRIGREQTQVYVGKLAEKIKAKCKKLRKINAAKEEKAKLKAEMEAKLKAEKLAFERTLKAEKLEFEKKVEAEKLAFERKLKAEKLEFEKKLEAEKLEFEAKLKAEIEGIKRDCANEAKAQRIEHAKSLNYDAFLTACDDYTKEVEQLLSRNSIITEAQFFEKEKLVRKSVVKEFKAMLTGNSEIREEFVQKISNRLYKIQESILRKIQTHNVNVGSNASEKAQADELREKLIQKLEDYKRALEAANNQNSQKKKKKGGCRIF